MWKKLGIAALTALVVVTIAELSARMMLGGIAFGHSYDEPRNPNFRRAWTVFTEPRPRDKNEKLVILISNSQGFASEYEDGNLCYAHQLELLLNEQDPTHRYTVANWSIGGASGPEKVLLAARAVDHDPDLLMLVTHGNPFNHRRLEQPLSFYLSDVNQLAYHQSVRQRLPGWFLRKQRAYDFTTLLEAHSGLVQLSSTYVEQRDARWSLVHRLPVKTDKPRSLRTAREVRQSGQQMLKTWVEVFSEGCPGTPVLMVSMPLNQSGWKPESWPYLTAFGDYMQELSDAYPNVEAVDAIHALEQEVFVTHTHFSAQGHAEFAQFLLPYVQEQLALPTNRSRPSPRH